MRCIATATASRSEYIVRDMDWAGQRQRMIVVRDLTESRAAQDRIRFLAVRRIDWSAQSRAPR